MINSERILLALDRRMDHELRLVIYGRAAIALGFFDRSTSRVTSRVKLSSDGIQQLLKLLINVSWTGDRLRDLRANEFAVTLS